MRQVAIYPGAQAQFIDMKINPDLKKRISIGMIVETNASGSSISMDHEKIIGTIGEITYDSFFIWQNVHDGSRGCIPPSSKGFAYSWQIYFENFSPLAYIKILQGRTKKTPTERLLVRLLK